MARRRCCPAVAPFIQAAPGLNYCHLVLFSGLPATVDRPRDYVRLWELLPIARDAPRPCMWMFNEGTMRYIVLHIQVARNLPTSGLEAEGGISLRHIPHFITDPK